MTRSILLAAISALATTPAFAMPKDRFAQITAPIPVGSHCPPGLAKKDPPCIPPGQARKRGYDVGDRYDGEWDVVEDGRYDLPPLEDGEGYVRVGDQILRVDRNQRLTLDVLDLLTE